MAGMRAIVEHVLKGHEPYPALAVDRHWNMIAANDAIAILIEQLSPALLAPPVNVLRIALHPEDWRRRSSTMASGARISSHRLDLQIEASGDAGLIALRDELAGYAVEANDNGGGHANGIAVPLILDTVAGRIRFVSTVTIFGRRSISPCPNWRSRPFSPRMSRARPCCGKLAQSIARHCRVASRRNDEERLALPLTLMLDIRRASAFADHMLARAVLPVGSP